MSRLPAREPYETKPEVLEMKGFIRIDRLLLAGVLAALAVLPLAQTALAGPPAPAVPGAIAVPEGHKPFLAVHAAGVQIYSCNATTGGYEWAFVAPRADLFTAAGTLVGTHFAGPTWQARDGSFVKAAVDGRATVDATAIPWLRLAATSTSAGPDGGRLTATSYIQRIATVGGLAPASSTCDAGTVGTTSEIPYTADYVFWKQAGR